MAVRAKLGLWPPHVGLSTGNEERTEALKAQKWRGRSSLGLPRQDRNPNPATPALCIPPPQLSQATGPGTELLHQAWFSPHTQEQFGCAPRCAPASPFLLHICLAEVVVTHQGLLHSSSQRLPGQHPARPTRSSCRPCGEAPVCQLIQHSSTRPSFPLWPQVPARPQSSGMSSARHKQLSRGGGEGSTALRCGRQRADGSRSLLRS